MIPPINCPYKMLTAPPCWRCASYIPDIDQCSLNSLATIHTVGSTSYTAENHAQTYQEKLKQYYEDRKKLLELSKDALVDLIIKPPTL